MADPHPADAGARGHLEDFRAKLRAFERDLGAEGKLGPQLTDQLDELGLALEEVEIADEAIARQTEHLLATQEALENERLRYRNLFRFAPYGCLATDQVGVVLEANQAALDLLQISAAAIRGKPLAVLVALSDVSRFRHLLERLRTEERVADWEILLRPRHRPPTPVEMTVIHQRVSSHLPPVFLWAVRDLSAVKEAETALRESEERLRHAQRLEAVGRLAGGVAHSFNNLLAAVAFHVELLAKGLDGRPDTEGLVRHVDEIRRTGERGAALASQLLAFGRRQVLKPEALDLNEVIARMEPMVRQLLGESAELELRLAPEASTVYFDLSQLEQVLMNLLVNARDAMPAGGRCTVETAAAEVADGAPAPGLVPGSYVRLSVADTGTGMPPHVRERIFEPFFTTKERGKGSGLGLSTVYGIVRQSGGAIRVESAAGRGARFDVYLLAAGEPVEREEPQPAAGEEDVRGDESILLVEDEASIRSAACELLEYQGYHVLAAAEATEALRLSAGHEGPLHLLVTDIVLQGMSGFQLAQRLAAERPGLCVLYMSGYPEDSIAEIGHLDRHSFLQKPFPPSQFLQAVRAALDRAGDAPPPGGQGPDAAG